MTEGGEVGLVRMQPYFEQAHVENEKGLHLYELDRAAIEPGLAALVAPEQVRGRIES